MKTYGSADETYGLYEAEKSEETFRDASKTARRWYYLWLSIALSLDCSSMAIATAIAFNTKFEFMSQDAVGFLSSLLFSIKALDTGMNFRGKASTADIISRNYYDVADKIDSALHIIHAMDNGNLTPDHVLKWQQLTSFISALIKQTTTWPSATVTTNEDVKSAIQDLNAIEDHILSASQSQSKV
jgi:hypothetical protein